MAGYSKQQSAEVMRSHMSSCYSTVSLAMANKFVWLAIKFITFAEFISLAQNLSITRLAVAVNMTKDVAAATRHWFRLNNSTFTSTNESI